MNQIFYSSNYSFNPHAIPTLFMGVFMFILGIYVFKQNRKSIVNFAFLMLCMSLLFWLAGFTMTYLSRDKELALFWYKYFSFFGVVFISPNVYFFTVSLLNLFKRQKWFVLAAYPVASLFYLLMIKTDYFVIGAKKYFWGWHPLYGPISYPFLAFFFVLMLTSFWNYIFSLRKIDVSVEKKRIKYVFIGLLLAYIGSVDYIANYGIGVYPFGFIPICIFGLFITYAILKYRLMVITPALAADTIIETMGEALLVLDRQRKVQLLNQVAKDLLGYSQEELEGKPITTFITDPSFSEQLDELTHTDRLRDYDIVYRSKQGNTSVFSLSATAIKDEMSQPVAIVCILKDITERKKMEEALRDSEEKHRTLVENVNIGVYRNTGGPQGHFIQANPAIVKMFGYESLDEFFKIHVSDLYEDPQDRQLFIEEISRQGFVKNRELRLRRKDGTPIYGSVTATASYDESGNIKWTDGVIEDISERKKAEIELRNAYNKLKEAQAQLVQSAKMAAVGQLGAGVAHELNNPLGGILGYAQFVLEKIKRPEFGAEDFKGCSKYLESIEREAARCKGIVENLLKFSRRPIVVKPEALDIAVAIDDTLSIIGHQLKLKNIKLALDIKPDLCGVIGIINQLQQVFTNLILNAQQAMPESGELKITAQNILDEKTKTPTHLRIEFTDSGCGISEENLKHLFEPFFTTKQKEKGTGLGLAVSYQIIQDHKGSLEVTSQVGKGTTVTITLPVVEGIHNLINLKSS
jgi:PAS domain S-box-containing protein